MNTNKTTGTFGNTGNSAVPGANSWSSSDVNNGVTCEVVSCEHYCEGHKCNADTIHVGNTNANTSYETRCDTFKEKSGSSSF